MNEQYVEYLEAQAKFLAEEFVSFVNRVSEISCDPDNVEDCLHIRCGKDHEIMTIDGETDIDVVKDVLDSIIAEVRNNAVEDHSSKYLKPSVAK